MKIEFKQEGTFAALHAAEAWCETHGISVGQSCATGPTGLLFGKWDWIAKWRNLTPKERKALHGVLTGDMRNGPVTITLADEAARKHGLVIDLDTDKDSTTLGGSIAQH